MYYDRKQFYIQSLHEQVVMDELGENIYQWIYPSSPFAQSILRRNKLSQFVHVFASLMLITKGTLGLYIVFWEKDYSNNPLRKLETVWHKLNYIFTGLAIFYYLFSRVLFLKFVKSYNEIIHGHESNVYEFIMKKRRKIKYFILWSIGYEIINEIAKSDTQYVPEALLGSENYITRYILFIIVLIGYKTGLIIQSQFLLEICSHLESAFHVHKRCLVKLSWCGKDSKEKSSLEKLKLCRLMYTKIVEATRYIDKFFTLTLVSFYFMYVGLSLFIVRDLFEREKTLTFVILNSLRFIGETTYISVITYHLIRVIQLSNKLFNEIYFLSFEFKSFWYSNEVNFSNLIAKRLNNCKKF